MAHTLTEFESILQNSHTVLMKPGLLERAGEAEVSLEKSFRYVRKHARGIPDYIGFSQIRMGKDGILSYIPYLIQPSGTNLHLVGTEDTRHHDSYIKLTRNTSIPTKGESTHGFTVTVFASLENDTPVRRELRIMSLRQPTHDLLAAAWTPRGSSVELSTSDFEAKTPSERASRTALENIASHLKGLDRLDTAIDRILAVLPSPRGYMREPMATFSSFARTFIQRTNQDIL